MDTYDLHGYLLEDAINFVEKIIGEIRLSKMEKDVLIITGRGIIRKKLIEYLDLHKIEHRFELGNDGAIVISID